MTKYSTTKKPSQPPKDPDLHSWRVFVRSGLFCLVAGILLFGFSLKKIEQLPLDQSPLLFDGKSAHVFMWDLSKKFPNRLPWHENKQKAAAWISHQFQQMNYTVQEMPFSEVIHGKQYTNLKNLYVEKKGTTHPDEIIIAMAHYDSAETTKEGAMDDASGVGVVLELARVFSKIETKRTMIFLLTDSEEFGAFWGARIFAKRFLRKDQIIAALNFDFLAPEKQVSILALHDGLKTGFTPLWLRELSQNSLRSIGRFEVNDFNHIMEAILRGVGIPAADHGAFLAEGIPALNWVGQMEDFPRQMAHYHHTTNDVADVIEVQSFTDQGEAAERLLRSLNRLEKVPDNFRNSSYWKITDRRYIDGWVAKILHLLAFVPFLMYSFTKFRPVLIARNRSHIKNVLKNEAKQVAILLASFLVGYVVILLLPGLDVIAEYESFPATQKAPILESPRFLVIMSVIFFVIATYYALKRVYSNKQDSLEYYEVRHAFHTICLAVVIAITCFLNTYLAVLALVPPAYCWSGMRVRRKMESKATNALYILGGLSTAIIILIIFSINFHIGPIYWYLFLATAYGLVSGNAVVIFLLSIAIMVRLIQNFVFPQKSKKSSYDNMEDFYKFYLTQHKKRWTRILHFTGTSLGLIFLVASLLTGKSIFLFVGLFAGYFLAWVSHFFIEQNRPATFQYPLLSILSDFKFFFELLFGKRKF